MTTTPRRSMLAVTPPAFAGDDPIFAAIERFRLSDAAWLARATWEDDCAERGEKLAPAPGDDRTPELVRLIDENHSARMALAETVPTTLAGLFAMLCYLYEWNVDDKTMFLFDDDEEIAAFTKSMAKCAHKLRSEVRS